MRPFAVAWLLKVNRLPMIILACQLTPKLTRSLDFLLMLSILMYRPKTVLFSITLSRPVLRPILIFHLIKHCIDIHLHDFFKDQKLYFMFKSVAKRDFRMILIVLAAVFWGVTNPFLKNGGVGMEEESSVVGKFIRLLKNWKFLIPFGLNQFGSLLYYYSMGQYPISIAVTVVNALTLIITTITSYALGEAKLGMVPYRFIVYES